MKNKIDNKVKMQTVKAVIIRADGKREDLGVISYWHKNPLKRLMFRVQQFFKDLA